MGYRWSSRRTVDRKKLAVSVSSGVEAILVRVSDSMLGGSEMLLGSRYNKYGVFISLRISAASDGASEPASLRGLQRSSERGGDPVSEAARQRASLRACEVYSDPASEGASEAAIQRSSDPAIQRARQRGSGPSRVDQWSATKFPRGHFPKSVVNGLLRILMRSQLVPRPIPNSWKCFFWGC